MRRIAFMGAAVVASLTLAACGSNSKSSTAGASSASAGPHNAADAIFAQMMIPHHEQAIEMAKLAPNRASSAEVKTLATQIQGAQDPEINQMKGWLSSWGEPTAMPGGMEHHSALSGMMSPDDMTRLEALSGKAFDREFLRMMTMHHQGAIEMARTEQADGRYDPARTLAANIVRSQSDEVNKMADLLKAM